MLFSASLKIEITSSDEKFHIESSDTEHKLTISKCRFDDDKSSIRFNAQLDTDEVFGSVKLKVQPATSSLKPFGDIKDVYCVGDTATFTLLISGHPEPFEVDWFKGFKRIEEDEIKYEVDISSNKVSLVLKDLDPSDAATYKCLIKSSTGKSEYKYNPIKILDEEEIVEEPKDQDVQETETEITSEEAALLEEGFDSWASGDDVDDEGRAMKAGRRGFGYLDRKRPKKEDNTLLKTIEKLKPQVIEEGDNATFKVLLSATVDEFKWFINKVEVSPSERFLTATTENEFTLTVKECSLEDDNTSVRFNAKLDTDEVFGSVKLKVQPAAPSLKPLGDVKEVYCAGDNETFALLIRGHPEPFEIDWYKGFEKIGDDEARSEIEISSKKVSLLLRDMEPSDASIYKCVIKSSGGESEYAFLPFSVKDKHQYEQWLKSHERNKNDDKDRKDVDAKPESESLEKGSVEDDSSAIEASAKDTAKVLEEEEPMLEEVIEQEQIIPEEVDDGTPFVVKEKMKPITATSDEKATLFVRLSKPAKEFKWFVNNVEITPESEKFTLSEDDALYSLTFKNCTMDDDKKAVKYVATCFKKQLTDSTRMKVKPATPELICTSQIKDLYEVGEEVRIDLDIKGHKEPFTVNFAKGFRKISEQEGKVEINIVEKHVSFILKNIDSTDAGTYKCTVKSSVATSELKFKPIKVNKTPEVVKETVSFEIEEKMKPVVAECGDSADFNVVFNHEPESISWYINDQEVKPSDKYTIDQLEKKYFLRFNYCEMEDTKASIKFIAKIKDKELANSVKLKVQAAAPGLKPLGDVKEVYCVGDTATFTLLISGHPEPFEIDWFKGFKKIEEDEIKSEIQISTNKVSFILKYLDLSDAASYKCVIKSSTGKSEYKYNAIKIKEKLDFESLKAASKDSDTSSRRQPSFEKILDEEEIVEEPKDQDVQETETEITAEEAALLEEGFDSWASGDDVDDEGRAMKAGRRGFGYLDRKRPKKEDNTLLSIIEKLKPQVIEEGDNATLKVLLSAKVDEFKWFINKVEVFPSERFLTVTTENEFTLTVKECSLEDDNTSVRFNAKLDTDEVFGSVKLKVQPAAPSLKPLGDVKEVYCAGDSETFALLICGHPEPFEIDWYKGFKKIEEDKARSEIEISSKKVSLLLRDMEPSDESIYKCVIKSSAGETEYAYLPFSVKDKHEYEQWLKSQEPNKNDDKDRQDVDAKPESESLEEGSVEDDSSAIEASAKDTAKVLEEEEPMLEEVIEQEQIIPEEVDDGTPFLVKEKMKPITATSDEKATLCVRLSKPAKEFKWFVNNVEITPESEKFTLSEDDGLYSLTFKNCTMDDDKKAVKYVATCFKKQLTDSTRMKVKPATPELICTSQIKDLYEVGEEVRIDLDIKGHKEPFTVNFAKGFRKISEQEGKVEINIVGKHVSFILKNIDSTDAGTYKCTVKSSVATSELKFKPIKVNKTPEVVKETVSFEIEEKMKPVVAECGDSADFNVVFNNEPESISWYINDQEVKPSDKYTIDKLEKKYSLRFNYCEMEDTKASIKFIAKIKDKELANSVKLKVQPAAPGLKPLGDVKEVYCVSDTATFTLLISGHPEPFEINWFKGFKKIEEDENKSEIQISPNKVSFVLKDLDPSDAATYKCVIKSSSGKSEYKYNPIKIKEKLEFERWQGFGDDDTEKGKRRSASREGSVDDAQEDDKEVLDSLPEVEEDAMAEEETDLEEAVSSSFDSWASDEGDGGGRAMRGGRRGFGYLDRKRPKKEDNAILNVIEKLKPQVVEDGDGATFKVLLSAEVDDFKWFINKVEVAPSDERFLMLREDRDHVLAIENCTIEDDKMLVRFLAQLDTDEVFGSVRLSVTSESPALRQINDVFEEYTEESTIPLKLMIRGHPEPFEISWFKGFKKVEHAEGRTEIIVNSRQVSLFVKNVQKNDAGIYKCVIKSSNGTSEFKYNSISIKPKPAVVYEPFNVTEKMKPVVAECGESAIFTAGFSETPDQVKWYINNVEIDINSENFKIEMIEKKSAMTILKCSMEDDKKSVKYVATRANSKDLTNSTRLKVQEAVPGLQQIGHLKDTYEEEEEIKFDIEVKGHPDAYTVQWFKGFKQVNINDGQYSFFRKGNRTTFIIKSCQMPDAGTYKVVVKSAKATTELKFNSFKVKEKIPDDEAPSIDAESFQDMDIKEGETLELIANIKGFPVPTIEWYKGSTVVKSTKRIILSNDKSVYKLKITRASLEDAGDYKIVATNKVSTASLSANVIVGCEPKFGKELTDFEVDDMDPAVFEVEVDHADSVTWFLDDEPVSEDEDFEFKQMESHYSYTIRSVNPSDHGKYEARATNKYGTTSSTCQLVVKVPTLPVINIDIPNNGVVECKEGESFELKFDVEGEPAPEVFFFKDEESMEKENGRAVITRIGRTHWGFFMSDLKESDSGKYVIEAETKAGVVEKEFEIKVTAVKLPPSVNVDLPESGIIKAKAGKDLEIPFDDIPEDANFTFYKDGKEMDMGRAVNTRMGRRHLFFMGDLKKKDSGKYSVEIETDGGKVTKEFEISIPDVPTVDVDLPESGIIKGKAGKDLEIPFDNIPEDADVTFFKNGKEMDMGRAVNTRMGRRHLFFMGDLKKKDSGKYSVEIETDGGKVTKEFEISVPDVPTVDFDLPEDGIIKGKEGKDLEIPFDNIPEDADVTFFKNGNEMDMGRAVVTRMGRRHLFFMGDLKRKDSGKYSVEVENDGGKISKDFELAIREKPSVRVDIPDNGIIRGKAGEDFEIPFDNIPEGADVTFFKNGKEMDMGRAVNTRMGRRHLFFMGDLKKKDSGKYSVEIETDGEKITKEFELDIKDAPTITVDLPESGVIRGKAGKDFELPFDNIPEDADVTFFKNGKEMDMGRAVVRRMGRRHLFFMGDLKRKDSGKYSVEVKTEGGKITKEFELEIPDVPTLKVDIPKDGIVKGKENEEIEIKFDVSDVEAELTFFKDGKEMDMGRAVVTRMGRRHLFFMGDLKKKDSGKYTVEIETDGGKISKDFEIEIKEKPTVTFDLPEDGVIIGKENEDFELPFNDIPEDAEVSFFKGRKKIDDMGRAVVTRTGRSHLFFIGNLRISDSGRYRVEIENEGGKTEKEFKIDVKEKPTVKVRLPRDGIVKAKEGEPFELKFEVSDEAEASFFKDGKRMDDMGRAVITRMGRTYRFYFPEVQKDDSGKYTVEIESEGGKIKKEFEIQVTAKPKALPTVHVKLPKDGILNIKEGEPFELNFEVSDDSEAIFYKGDNRIDDMGRAVVTRMGRTFRFYIPEVKESDSGQYIMEVQGESGITNKSFKIKVQGKPKKSPIPTIDVDLPDEPIKKREGDKFEVRFKISGQPHPEVFFFKDEKPIEEKSKKVLIKREGEYYNFTIPRLESSDSGLYVVECENKNGTVEKEFEIEVEGKSKKAPVAAPKPQLQSLVSASTNPNKPAFKIKLQDIEVVSFSAVRFEVVVKGDPEPEITWYKNNEIIDDDDRNFLQEEEEDGTCALVIREVSTNDRGTYKCMAKNRFGKAMTTAELFVEDHGFESDDSESELGGRSLPRTDDDDLTDDDLLDEEDELDHAQIILPMRDRHATIGSSAKFSCRAQSIKPHIPVEWYHDDKPVDLGCGRIKAAVAEEGELFTLNLRNVQMSDAGKYKIVFKLPNETLTSSANLNVDEGRKTEFGVSSRSSDTKKEPKATPPKPAPKTQRKPGQEEPTFVLEPKDKTVVEGNQLKLTASVNGKPTPLVEWYKENSLLKSSSTIDIQATRNLHNMVIRKATTKDAGVYRCTARNEAGQCTVEVNIKIDTKSNKPKLSPNHPAFTRELEDFYEAEEGNDVEMKVEFTGKPKPRIHWEKNGKNIVSIKRVKIHEEDGASQLLIKALRDTDFGDYSCTISNFHGNTKSTSCLRLCSDGTPDIHINTPSPPPPPISSTTNQECSK
ncbi:muscle M-line assembly protein unc-89-like [Clytia hemisphaerica]|uniref:muscle M-line assembly protein unc-89-like n=1 Tax=Clytia hemisphaerica TaxID=252671 RepID=UPI0034D4DFCE